MGMIFGWMMRRFSNMAIGAGVPSSVQVIEVEVDTWLGHVRVLNVAHRHCRRQDRSARARPQPGGGLGDPGHRLCAL